MELYSEDDDQLEVLTMQQLDFKLIRAVSGIVVMCTTILILNDLNFFFSYLSTG